MLRGMIAGRASLVVLCCCCAGDDAGSDAGGETIAPDTAAIVQAAPKPAYPACDPSSLVPQWRFVFGTRSVASQVV